MKRIKLVKIKQLIIAAKFCQINGCALSTMQLILKKYKIYNTKCLIQNIYKIPSYKSTVL